MVEPRQRKSLAEAAIVEHQIPSRRVRRLLSVHRSRLYYHAVDRPEDITISTDNGSEFLSTFVRSYYEKEGIAMRYIQPGKPTQNAYVERLNGSLRRELLDQHLFSSIADAQQLAEAWQWDYNNRRPHRSLRYKTPLQFARLKSNDKAG